MTAKMYYDNDANPAALAGQTVAIIGCGPIGLMAISVLRASGADFVAASELAAAAGMRSQSLILKLVALEVLPAAGPPACRQVFYRRSELTKARSLGRVLPAVRARAADRPR